VIRREQLRWLPNIGVVRMAVYHERIDRRSLLNQVEAVLNTLVQNRVRPYLNAVEPGGRDGALGIRLPGKARESGGDSSLQEVAPISLVIRLHG
jgi:hypothetical protein